MEHPSPTHERWRQVQRLFAEVAGLDPERQAARLAEADPALRAEAEVLLARFERGEAIRERPPRGPAPPPRSASPPPGPPSGRATPPEGDVVAGRYRIRRELGRGGMGVVFEAEDLRLGRGVALKFLSPHLHTHDRAKERFLVEAQAASALDHPNVCTVYEAGETEDGRLFIAMALYTGELLADRIAVGPLPVAEAADIALQVARGLCVAHREGIVHRDLKPANIFITSDGVVKLLDFGIAKVTGSELTQPGHALGTAAYAAPEQLHGKVDHRADLWALGVVLYEMLTGMRPFLGGDEKALMYAIVHEAPADLRARRPGIPPRLAAVVACCLKKDPKDRYSLAEEVVDALETVTGADRRSPRPRWQVWAGIGAATALLALALLPALQSARGLSDLIFPERQVRHLSVTPLLDRSGDPELAAGLTATVSDLVARIGRYAEAPLLVVPASQASGFSDARGAHRLGVTELVGGEVQHEGGMLRVTLTLTDARRARTLRSQTIEVPALRMAALQGGLVEAASALLGVTLRPDDFRALTAGGTVDPGAYAFYLKGRASLDRFDRLENVTTAAQLFRWAIQEDPAYALAYAGLCEAALHRYGHEPDPRWVAEAEADCARALSLESRLAPVHATLGRLYTRTGAYDPAVQAFRLALALDSLDAAAYDGMGRALAAAARYREAEDAHRRAIALAPGAWAYRNHLGELYLRTGRFEEAIQQFEALLLAVPDHAWGHNNLGAAHLYLGRLDEAEALFRRANTLQPTAFAYSNLGVIAYYRGRPHVEAQMYQRALALDSLDYVPWGNLAGAYKRLGDRSAEVAAFRRAIALVEARLDVNPDDPERLGDLAEYRSQVGEAGPARAATARALGLAPDDVIVLMQATRVYERLGDRDRALETVGRALAAGYPLADVETDDGLEDLRQDARFTARLSDS